ncbi:hypothetical protein AA0119_g10441 [Alternaria tenuissima]|uniref:PNPLA domain-containing protein n=1 Tax=Alternaria tenuissima TaxID=119927 RepID=A0ABY0FX34_9PLEO|nr:hypothetical protein AA0119_g10441 [Alternaria tenuissima]RYO03612.1 hypothetical protein AA0121_g12994 [Alternaria tenuissima]
MPRGPLIGSNDASNQQEDVGNDQPVRRLASQPKRVLCLDGGGIRGISTLLILQRIMEQIKDDHELEETPRPCDYFDLIGGTSTGGIIAIMLGRLGMTVQQCLEAYKQMAEKAFTPKANRITRVFSLPSPPKGEFSATSLANAIKDIVKEYTGDAEAVFADRTCVKTVVLAVTKVNVSALPKQFKTYHIEDDFRDCKIWEVARATSAATTFFKSISIGRQGIEFIDAGFGHNNPSEVLWSETMQLFPNDEHGYIISIGTGLGSVVTIKDTRKSILDALKAMATNSQAVHERLLRSRPLADYFRFNVTKGLEDMTLSDWKQSSTISAHTSNYLRELEVERQIERCAKILAQDTDPISSYQNTQQTPDHQSRDRRKHLDVRNDEAVVQIFPSLSAILDFIALIQREAPRSALVDHMVQHNIPPQTYQQILSQQSITQPVFFSNPVTIFTGITGCEVIGFSLDRVGSLLEFQQYMANAARDKLEERFKAKGSAKFTKGEFLLQDENEHVLSLRSPWKSIMKPGQRRYLSVKFRGIATTSCPHCGTDNKLFEGQSTICSTCQMTYQRIVELGSEEDVGQGTAVSRHEKNGPIVEDITEDELKLCFYRVTLYQFTPHRLTHYQSTAYHGKHLVYDRLPTPRYRAGDKIAVRKRKEKFYVASRRPTSDGKWVYRLMEMTGEPYSNGEWVRQDRLYIV